VLAVHVDTVRLFLHVLAAGPSGGWALLILIS
jgi:hypothetical protein